MSLVAKQAARAEVVIAMVVMAVVVMAVVVMVVVVVVVVMALSMVQESLWELASMLVPDHLDADP